MKRNIILFNAIALLVLATAGCEKKEKRNVILSDVKIIKEFNLNSNNETSKINCENGEIIIINSQKELDKIFEGSYVPEDLSNVDFDKNTVIVGNCVSNSGVEKLEHKFSKIGDKYEYLLTVRQNITHVAESVGFGILVEKIPSNSTIVFKINFTN